MRLLVCLAVVLWLGGGKVKAQTYSQSALLFSRIDQGGSSRILSLGGAQTALGGDYSSAFSNPAGLGMFNKSSVSISLGFDRGAANSSYLDNQKNKPNFNVNIPGLSGVFHINRKSESSFVGGAFGITYNRTNHHKSIVDYEATNTNHSIIDHFIEEANYVGRPSGYYLGGGSNSLIGLAYRNFLISDSSEHRQGASNAEFYSVMGTFPNDPTDTRSQLQQEKIQTLGNQGQVNLAYGANIRDRYFFGGGIGIASIRYQAEKRYTESQYKFSDPKYATPPLDNMVLNEELSISGVGLNATVGVIVRPVNMLQLGFSYITPTYYSIQEKFKMGLRTVWNNYRYNATRTLNNVEETTGEFESEYSLLTPGKLNAGITFFLRKRGFITGDVQWVNYGKAKYDSSNGEIDFNGDNQDIKADYTKVLNVRVGSEIRFGNFMTRIGFMYQPSPNKEIDRDIGKKLMGDVYRYSFGGGYRTAKYTIDVALLYKVASIIYVPYRLGNETPQVQVTKSNVSLVGTFNWFF